MAIDDRVLRDTRIHVGHTNQHADAAVRQLLGPFNLIEIFRRVVIDRGPKQAAQVLRSGRCRQLGMRLDCGQLRIGSLEESSAESRARS